MSSRSRWESNFPLCVTLIVLLFGVGCGGGSSTSSASSLSAGSITTVAGNGGVAYGGDNGPATSAELNSPMGVAVDASGNLYIADKGNNRVRKVSNGTITTVAGDGNYGFGGDGGAATSAELTFPWSVAVDGAGNLYIADEGNQCVREVAAATGVITTVAGTRTAGYNGDGGLATTAQLHLPRGVAVDGAGNLYIADTLNNRIRMVSAATGIITTVAGNGTAGYGGDNGPAVNAALDGPEAIAIDKSGNLYIADTLNNRVRLVAAATGNITTIAGDGVANYAGDSGLATAAELKAPAGVAVNASGNIYIADTGNQRVRMIAAATGIITTTAGIGTAGFSGDNAAATSAEVSSPAALALDASGNLYIADTGNNRIRKVAP